MKKFSNRLVALLAVFALHWFVGAGSALAQGIPVIDVANLVNTARNIVEWKNQLVAMKNQLDQAKQTYESLTKARNLSSIFNNPALNNYIPPEFRNVYNQVKYGGYYGMTWGARNIRDQNRIYDCNAQDYWRMIMCNRQANKAAQDQDFAMQSFELARSRIGQIEGMMYRAGQTQDQKELAEVQARISAESAMIQNELTKMEMFKVVSETEDRLLAQQKREIDQQNITRQVTINQILTPYQPRQ
jgi:type IV secretion system protein VirB5